MSRYKIKANDARLAPSKLSEIEELLFSMPIHPMNIARPVMPMEKLLRGKSAVEPKPILRRVAPVTAHDLPIPWNNMSQADNSKGDGPKPSVNEGIEELFAPETIAKPVPGLRRQVPAWTLSGVEGMENIARKNSKTSRPGRGFRTRKEGNRRRNSTRRRNYKA